MVPGLEEPLLRTHATDLDDDAALADAIDVFTASQDPDLPAHVEDLIGPFEAFAKDYPDSGWTPAVLTNLGLAYYHAGFFSRAFDAWTTAWNAGKSATDAPAKALMDRTIGELVRMHARVGHVEELESLFAELGDRPLTGSATELVAGAREGAWHMRYSPGNAFLCGPRALANVLEHLGASRESIAPADEARSGPGGFTLEQLSALADAGDLPHRLFHRRPGQDIPVPSIVNWKVNHYAAIVAEADGRYLIKDPTFGGDLLISRAAIDAEASGYFLVPVGTPVDRRWRTATLAEAASVRGTGYTTGSQPGAVTGDDPTVGGGCDGGLGMCVPDVHAMPVSLTLKDTPVGYSPQRGPSALVRLTYNRIRFTAPCSDGMTSGARCGRGQRDLSPAVAARSECSCRAARRGS